MENREVATELDQRPNWIKRDLHWLSDVELVSEWGFKAEALYRLFGEPTPGPDGAPSWLWAHVMHIDRTIIKPAVELLESSLQLGELADHFEDLDTASGISYDAKSRPSPKKATEILKALAENEARSV